MEQQKNLLPMKQVRRLYLGRNFELKRKDYLHEEARGYFEIRLQLQKTIHTRLIQFTEHTIEKTKSILRFIDDFGQGNNRVKNSRRI